jgi:hypothetical protein
MATTAYFRVSTGTQYLANQKLAIPRIRTPEEIPDPIWPKACPLPLAVREAFRGSRQAPKHQDTREKTMKIRAVMIVVGLAISFILPIFAQEKRMLNPFLLLLSLLVLN